MADIIDIIIKEVKRGVKNIMLFNTDRGSRLLPAIEIYHKASGYIGYITLETNRIKVHIYVQKRTIKNINCEFADPDCDPQTIIDALINVLNELVPGRFNE
jgi:hypothetical protein